MKRPMVFRCRLWAVFLLAFVIGMPRPLCQADEPAKSLSVGKRVVQRNREFKLRIGDAGIERTVPLDIWRVERVDGTKLSIRAELLGLGGLVTTDQVISIDQAMVYFTDQIREHPNDAFARVMRAELWRDKKEPDKALADCDEAVRLDPRDHVAYESHARIRLNKEQIDEAMRDCEKALQLNPQSAAAYMRRGSVLAIMHEYDKAIADFEHAIRLDPVQSFPHSLARLCVDGEERIHQGIR